MMAMENDEFRIPEQYRKMSVAQLDKEAKKLLEQINQLLVWFTYMLCLQILNMMLKVVLIKSSKKQKMIS